MRDDVLRCLLPFKKDGKNFTMTIDAIDDGDNYKLVFVWGASKGYEGEYPHKFALLPKGKKFTVVTASGPNAAPFELFYSDVLDLDTIAFSENAETPERIWADAANIFIPRPKD